MKKNHHLIPVITIILAIAAVVGMIAFSMWPVEYDLDQRPKVRATTSN